jgi:hypothetical protein
VTSPQPRTPQQRKQDTLDRLDRDVDAWVATSDGDGPYLVPLSFLWDGETLLLATAAATPTGHNLQATGRVRVGIGQTRDVVLVDGTVEVLTQVPDATCDAFAAKTGFDPRLLAETYPWFSVRPQRIQAWREVDELAGRDVMRDGRWTVP